MSSAFEQTPELYIEDFKQIGIDEYFQSQADYICPELHQVRKAGLYIARLLTDIGVFDDTPRIYGATDNEELLVFPHFKFRTMPRMTAERRATIYEDIRLGLRSKSHSNATRTTFGRFLAKTSLDEFPVHPIIGTHGWFGNVRPILIPEFLSAALTEELDRHDLSRVKFAQAMRPGFATTYAWLGARTLDPSALVAATQIAENQQPTKLQLLRAVASRDFLTKTS